jgi:pyruvate kinase
MLALAWGVISVRAEDVPDLNALVAHGLRAVRQLGIAHPGDRIVVATGDMAAGRPGGTSRLEVTTVE